MSLFYRRSFARLLVVCLLIACSLSWLQAGRAFAGQVAQEEPTEPEIGAKAAIVVEYPSGRVLYSKGAHDRMPPASTTKILTAILALEYGKLDDVFTATDDDLVGESSMGLKSGEQQTLHDLLYGMMLPSGNDAAMVVARGLANRVGTGPGAAADPIQRFAQMMNTRVAQLGLKDSHFLTPHGLDQDGHYSSAYDLASLSWYALHFPVFNEVVRAVSYEAPGHSLLNTNEMLTRYPGADGIKTGWTDGCGLCLVTSATRDGHRLISVVLNAPRWYTDSAAILDYGFAKLAAQPTDPQAEVLDIAKRGAADWLLQNGAPPPLLEGQQPPRPAVVPTAALAQGGGAVPGANAANKSSVAAGAADQGSGRTLLVGGSSGQSITPWALMITALVGMVLFYAVAIRLKGLRFRPIRRAARNRSSAEAGTHFRPMPEGQTTLAYTHHRAAPMPQDTVAPRTWRVAASPAPALQRERREPNLLVELSAAYTTHVARAVQLAWDERQGSSMSEFLAALRLKGDLDVAEVVAAHQLNATGFMALAGAQSAAGHYEDAHRTLTHGILVLPHERILRMAIKQVEASMCA